MSADSRPYNSVFTTETAVGVWQTTPDSYDLPHPKVQEPVIKIVCRVLAHAFETLRSEGKNLNALSEDEITAGLMEYLENTVLKANGDPSKGGIPGFTRIVFRSVTRQSNAQSYNQQKIRPSPDLWFLLNYDDRQRTLPSYDALLVECKIVSSKKHHEVGSWYCDNGLIRFVNGDYAWAMTESLMLGYVRDDRSMASHLIPAMQDADRLMKLQTLSQPTQITAKAVAAIPCCREPIHVSTHGRGFEYKEGKGNAPAISIYHLWCY